MNDEEEKELKITDKERIDWLENKFNYGHSPALVTDDNGHWAVSFIGIQNVSFKKRDLDVMICVKTKQWKKTIRKAIDYAIIKENKLSKEFKKTCHPYTDEDAKITLEVMEDFQRSIYDLQEFRKNS